METWLSLVAITSLLAKHSFPLETQKTTHDKTIQTEPARAVAWAVHVAEIEHASTLSKALNLSIFTRLDFKYSYINEFSS